MISSLAVWSLSICCISCLSVLDSWAIMNNDDDDDDDGTRKSDGPITVLDVCK